MLSDTLTTSICRASFRRREMWLSITLYSLGSSKGAFFSTVIFSPFTKPSSITRYRNPPCPFTFTITHSCPSGMSASVLLCCHSFTCSRLCSHICERKCPGACLQNCPCISSSRAPLLLSWCQSRILSCFLLFLIFSRYLIKRFFDL